MKTQRQITFLCLALSVLTLMTISLHANATPSSLDAEIESYRLSIQNKGAAALTLEASVGLGLTVAHCGPSFAVNVYNSIANSTDLETFTAEFKKTSPSEKCTRSSIKLGTALSLLKSRSAESFERFMNMARNRIAEELKAESK
jgi:hypothetical protein